MSAPQDSIWRNFQVTPNRDFKELNVNEFNANVKRIANPRKKEALDYYDEQQAEKNRERDYWELD